MFNDEDNIIYVSSSKEELESNPKSGIALDPSNDYTLLYADLHSEDSVRSWKDGILDVLILRPNVLSIPDLSFLSIEQSKFISIMNALKLDKDGGFYASIFIDELGSRKVFHMYRSDRSIARHKFRSGWRYDLTVSIIEM